MSVLEAIMSFPKPLDSNFQGSPSPSNYLPEGAYVPPTTYRLTHYSNLPYSSYWPPQVHSALHCIYPLRLSLVVVHPLRETMPKGVHMQHHPAFMVANVSVRLLDPQIRAIMMCLRNAGGRAQLSSARPVSASRPCLGSERSRKTGLRPAAHLENGDRQSRDKGRDREFINIIIILIFIYFAYIS